MQNHNTFTAAFAAYAQALANGKPQDTIAMFDTVSVFQRLLRRSDTFALPDTCYYNDAVCGALEDFITGYEADPSEYTQAQAAHLRAVVKDIAFPTYVRPSVFVDAIVEDWHRLHQSQTALRLLTEIAKAEAVRTEA